MIDITSKILSEIESKLSKDKNRKIIIVNNIYINSVNDLKSLNEESVNIINSENLIDVVEWKNNFLKKNNSYNYQKQLIAKLPILFDKNQYSPTEFLNLVKIKQIQINSNERLIKLVRSILNFCEDEGLLNNNQLIEIKSKIKSKPIIPDNFVPTDLEIKDSLDKLSLKHKQLYLLFLTSGLRKIEGIYLLNNFNNLRYQEYSDYVKINMSYKRKNKNSYFCYLPRGIYIKLKVFFDKITIVALEQEIKRKKLIPIKYCRKWFFTKCVELGIPETIADFYEGRVANSVGSNHYLSRQMLGDKYYSKANNFFVKFFDLKKGCIYDIV